MTRYLGYDGFVTSLDAKLLFPWSIVVASQTEHFWQWALYPLFMQFPIYAVAIVLAGVVRRTRPVVVGVLALHGVGILLALAIG